MAGKKRTSTADKRAAQKGSAAPKPKKPRSPEFEKRSRLVILKAFDTIVRGFTEPILQATLIKSVAFSLFAQNKDCFEWHPSASLTWRALEALEDNSVVKLVDYIKKPLYGSIFPAAVHAKLKQLKLHRHKISHPFETEWTQEAMRQFAKEKREYEARVPFVWDLYLSWKQELISAGLPTKDDFPVTYEMAHMLRLIWEGCMKQHNIATIPDRDRLVELLQGCRTKQLKQCEELAQKNST